MINDYVKCELCPRKCGVNRYESRGICGMGAGVQFAKAMLHQWEEPCISYKNGAGTIFFYGCGLHCVYCQNHKISSEPLCQTADIKNLGDTFLKLQEMGADNIELVTASHFLPDIINALDSVKHRLNIPVVYNSGGYELADSIRRLDGYVDVYIPDIKYFSPEISKRYSSAPDYFECASRAVLQMINQTGNPQYNSSGGLVKGVVIRHLVLPNCRHDSMKILGWIAENFMPEQFLLSLMSQYTPFDFIPDSFPELKRRITKMEYNSVLRYAQKLGFQGFMQEKSSADKGYVPDF